MHNKTQYIIFKIKTKNADIVRLLWGGFLTQILKIRSSFICCFIRSRCTKAFKKMTSNEVGDIDYEIYRSACIKEFEILMEQSGKLLRKVLGQYEHSKKAVDSLTYKDIFRKSVLRGLISVEESDRWMDYRDNRNNTAHDYGENFAEETLKILEQFLIDCKSLAQVINTHKHDS